MLRLSILHVEHTSHCGTAVEPWNVGPALRTSHSAIVVGVLAPDGYRGFSKRNKRHLYTALNCTILALRALITLRPLLASWNPPAIENLQRATNNICKSLESCKVGSAFRTSNLAVEREETSIQS